MATQFPPMATTSPFGPTYDHYRTPELDSARRRGRYYQQLSYKLSRQGNNVAAQATQEKATMWFEIFESMCAKFENPTLDEPWGGMH